MNFKEENFRTENGWRPRGIPSKFKGAKFPNRKKAKRTPVFTRKQRKWADIYMETGNQQEAAIEAYEITPETPNWRAYATVLGSKNRKNPIIQQYMQSSVDIASKTITDLAQNAENERVRLSAAQDILDRLGLKAPDRIEIDDKRELTMDDYEAIRRVQSVLKLVPLEMIKPVAGEIKEAETYDDEREVSGSVEPTR